MRKLQNTDIFRTIVMHWNAQRNADESNRSAKVRSHKKKRYYLGIFPNMGGGVIPDNCRRRGRRRQCKFFWPV